MSKPDTWETMTETERKDWKRARRKARRKARRVVLGNVWRIMGPLADVAVKAAAGMIGLSGDARATYAVAQLSKLVEAAPVDTKVKGLGTVLAGAVEDAYQRHQDAAADEDDAA